MKPYVAILAGGLGTRLSEETIIKPKPMVEIGGKPILWHIMKIYSHYGFNRFVIALGYKGEVIKDYFLNYPFTEAKQVNVNLCLGEKSHSECNERWDITLLETGQDTQISGRVRQIMEFTKDTTLLTYGDGLADINICDLMEFHHRQGKIATITAVCPPSRFGRVVFSPDGVSIDEFDEKPVEGGEYGDYINGGFMVLEPDILKLGPYADDEIFERVYLPRLARKHELAGYVHSGFWQCMDTIREKQMLNQMWENKKAKWKVWND
jgi:glucose-1-phosphate cytidylyltransferase